MRQRRKTILLLTSFRLCFAVRTQPNSLGVGISFDITLEFLTHLEFFRRILMLHATKSAVSRLFFRLIADLVPLNFAALSRIAHCFDLVVHTALFLLSHT